MKRVARRIYIVIGFTLVSSLLPMQAGAVSPQGYAQFPNLALPPQPPDKTVPVSGTLGPYTWPGKGTVTATYSNSEWRSRAVVLNEALRQGYLDLGFNSLNNKIPAFWQYGLASGPAHTTLSFSEPTSRFALNVFDVDETDRVKITATDIDGNTITDFSGWQVLATGDQTTIAGSDGGPEPSTAPLWNSTTGTVSSGETAPNNNSNRSFIVIKPPVGLRITRLDFDLTSTANGQHVYYALYGYESPDLSLGSKVWNDADNDGVHDVGEAGFQNVEVELYDDSGNLLASTQTDANGTYAFSGLVPGNYQLRLPASNFQPGGALAGYRSSGASVGDPNTPTEGINYGLDGSDLATDGVSLTGPVALFWEGGPTTDGDSADAYSYLDFGLTAISTADPDDGGTTPATPTVPDAPDSGVAPLLTILFIPFVILVTSILTGSIVLGKSLLSAQYGRARRRP